MNVTVTIRSYRTTGEPAQITAGELGVLLTATNRVVNYVVYKALRDPTESEKWDIRKDEASPWFGRRSLRYEPDLLTLPITEVRSGSVILQATIDFFNTIGLDRETANSLLQNLIAAGLWVGAADIYTKRAFGAAIQRISPTARGKRYSLNLKIGGSSITIQVEVGNDGRVKVTATAPPEPRGHWSGSNSKPKRRLKRRK
jgi:hypothetical protein